MFNPMRSVASAMSAVGPKPKSGGGFAGIANGFLKQRQQQQAQNAAGQPSQPTLSPGQTPGAQPTPAAAPSPLAQAMQPSNAGSRSEGQRPDGSYPTAAEQQGGMQDLNRDRAAAQETFQKWQSQPQQPSAAQQQATEMGNRAMQLQQEQMGQQPYAPAHDGPQTADDVWGNNKQQLPWNLAQQQAEQAQAGVNMQQEQQDAAKRAAWDAQTQAMQNGGPQISGGPDRGGEFDRITGAAGAAGTNDPGQDEQYRRMQADAAAQAKMQRPDNNYLDMMAGQAGKNVPNSQPAVLQQAPNRYGDMLQGIAAKQGSDRGIGAQLAQLGGQMGQKPWAMTQGMQKPAAPQPWSMLPQRGRGAPPVQSQWNMLRR